MQMIVEVNSSMEEQGEALVELYGITARSGAGAVLYCARGLTANRARAEQFAQQLQHSELTCMELPYLIEDFLA